MKINVNAKYPENMEQLEKKASDLLASIFIEKFKRKEIDKMIEMLEKDPSIIQWWNQKNRYMKYKGNRMTY